MKHVRKIACLLLSLILVFALATTASAQTVDSEKGGSASITISNAAKGETYKVVKLFDASVTGEENGSIVYTGTIPDALKDYFEYNTDEGVEQNKYIVAKEESLSEAAIAAMKTWAAGETATASEVSDGSKLTFTNLPYGYYVITTTQGIAITVDSTNPSVTIYDKNTKEPSVTKSVDDADVYIGQTVTYTVEANTANYLGQEEAAEIVTKYVIADTLPDFLTDVTVKSIIIDEDADTATTTDQKSLTVEQFGDDKKIEIAWIDANGSSLYKNGSKIIVTYTAKVTDKATIDGDGNENVVSLTPYTDNDTSDDTPADPWGEPLTDNAVIYTYATALQKVGESNDNKKPLAGAKFAAKGLTVEGSAGDYTVTAYNPDAAENGTEMECDAQGQLVIKGLPSDAVLVVTETEAPAGYNKIAEPKELPVIKIDEEVKATEQTIYYDENGKVTDQVTTTSYTKTTYNVKLLKLAIAVVNKAGSVLPATGGMGTTLFYVVGGLMAAGALVLLVTKKRMAGAK